MSKEELQKGFKYGRITTALTKCGERWEGESQPEVNELLPQSRADLDSAAELKHLRPLSGAATSNFNGLYYYASCSTA